MILKSKIKNYLRKNGFSMNECIDKNQLLKFLNRFKEHYVTTELIRIGGDNDGGYLLPDILNDIKYCFSPGVDYTSTFEKMLSERYGIKSFMIDASVDSTPVKDSNFEFEKLFLGSYTHDNIISLSDWLDKKLPYDENNLLLQMDIESFEYDVLTTESLETLNRFSCMIVEFHSTEKIIDSYFFRMISGIFEKLYKNFSICHVHPNNLCGYEIFNGIKIPRTFEITFLRNDYVKELKIDKKLYLPHELDQRNSIKVEDFTMPKIWWEK